METEVIQAITPENPHAVVAVTKEATHEARCARMRVLAAEAMADPDFVSDLHETMQAFQHTDSDDWPFYDEK